MTKRIPWTRYPPSDKEGFYRWMSQNKDKNEVEVWQFLFKDFMDSGGMRHGLTTDAGEPNSELWRGSSFYRGVWQGPYKTKKEAEDISDLDFTSTELAEERRKGCAEHRKPARTSRANHRGITLSGSYGKAWHGNWDE